MLALLLSLSMIMTFPAHAGGQKTMPYTPLDSTASFISDSSETRHVQIDKIFILGNKKTKEQIILRELSVVTGQAYNYKVLKAALEKDKNKLVNTQLFNHVDIITLDLSHEKVDIVIKVSERWYIFPIPIFDLVDRNFNDWWANQGRNIKRINYGASITKGNSRGRNEELKLTAQFGFTRKFQLKYSVPYIDRSQRHGLSLYFQYSENKNIAFRTEDHVQRFLDSDKTLRTRNEVTLNYSYRESFYEFHNVSLGYSNNSVSDTVILVNPDYFLSGKGQQKYLTLRYGYHRDKRDLTAYPLSGFGYGAVISKSGLGIYNDINQLAITLYYSKYFDLNKGFYLASYTKSYLSGPNEQPYNNLNGLGYGRDFVRGYELYLIEGQGYALNKTSLKKRLMKGKKKIGFLPEQFRQVPYAIYLKTYFDVGFVDNFNDYEQNTRLSDRYIFGTGLGLDIVTFYDLVYRFEYSVNREGEKGFFFHFKKEF